VNKASENQQEIALDEWAYDLPSGRIARHPAQARDRSKLLRIDRATGSLEDQIFRDIQGELREGDLLVGNDTRVMAARLYARRQTGGAVELLVLEPGPGPVRALARPARRLKEGEVLALNAGGKVTIHEAGAGRDHVLVEFDRPPLEIMADHGEIPLPPYLKRPAIASDWERYQTVYAGPLGAVAAPTAGLHFTPDLLTRLREGGISFATVTLHVGIGTFRPVRHGDLERGTLHMEPYSISAETVGQIRETRARRGRVIAVGTTATRALESATPPGENCPVAGVNDTTLFIRPPYRFRCIDGLITNFHLPKSSLLMLVASFIDRDKLFHAYEHAIQSGYRFYSYGDAMLIL
jgi:S-adenosylmethionine:tRNA ribosyltransferase-isomerase